MIATCIPAKALRCSRIELEGSGRVRRGQQLAEAGARAAGIGTEEPLGRTIDHPPSSCRSSVAKPRRGTPAARRSVAPLLLRLWACIGLAVLMLTGSAGVASATPSGATAAASMSAGAEAVDSGGRGLDRSTERCLPARDDRNRVAAHELGAVELELDDGDMRSDTGAIATATAPVLESSRISTIAARASADTGRPRVATALARGPPVA